MEVFNVNFNGAFEDLKEDIEEVSESVSSVEASVNSAMPRSGGAFTGQVAAAAPGADTFSTPQLVNAIVLAKGSSPKTDLPAGTLQFILK